MVMVVPTFLNVDGDGTAVPDQGDGWFGMLVASQTGHPLLGRDVQFSRSSVDDVRAESPSVPEAIEDQLQSGGPYGTVSLIGDTQNRPGIGSLRANQGSPQQEAPLP